MNSRDPSVGLPGSLERAMPDVQGSTDHRRQPIQRVGVRGLRYPMLWRSGDVPAPTVAVWSLFVSLPAEQKGTHMSRFVALLERRARDLSPDALVPLHAEMLELLEAPTGRFELSFPLFVSKVAPVSGVASTMDYEVSLTVDGPRDAARVDVKVVVPVTSLCPCSKEISDYGAHNQRSHVTVEARLEPAASLDVPALIARIEAQASCELWGLLKRVDEKHVTERAYDNPKFVEDLVRDVAAAVREVPGVASFVVEGENFESIHNHSAYARIEA
ncbi:MAG: cyclohydrolase folE2 [Pseudomonadota bacterium]|jgi:GTP cyclohydrolase I